MSSVEFGPRLRRLSGTLALLLLDVVVIWLSTLAAYFLRFQGTVPPRFLENVWPAAAGSAIVFPVVFALFGLYNYVWRFASVDVLLKTGGAVSVSLGTLVAIDLAVARGGSRPVPLGTLAIVAVFTFLGALTVRFYARFAAHLAGRTGASGRRSVVIVGAGSAGSLLYRDIRSHPGSGIHVAGFVDDDPLLRGRRIGDTRVLGGIDELVALAEAHSFEEAMVAIPSASGASRRRILDACADAGLPTRVVPSLTDGAEASVSTLRPVDVIDLLGREPVRIDEEQTHASVAGRVVAVTGAAGSIGSELCRQIADMGPSKLLLLEVDETRLYEVFLELREACDGEVVMRVCDIRDNRKLREILKEHRPEILIHAAAYKHVPLMELEPDEAVKTNVVGTRNALDACLEAGVARFVLISTDKAVAPTTVMGATKAVAELLALDAARQGLGVTVVRFGNVLGSRGSVVPLFEAQMRRGQALRVTHPDVTRYFMTIPEAVSLVLQAQAFEEHGSIYVLKMGSPVKIVDLAKKMISLSGAQVGIEYTGLRPAEKLHEALVHDEESLMETECGSVDMLNVLPMVDATMQATVEVLAMLSRIDDADGIKACLGRLVPSFRVWDDTSAPDSLDSEMETQL